MISQSINELLAETPASTEETVNKLILTSTFGMIDECGSLLAQEQQEIGTQYDRFFDYSLKLYQRSSQEVNYGTLLKDALAEAKLSIGVSEKLEKLVNGTSEWSRSESQQKIGSKSDWMMFLNQINVFPTLREFCL